MPLKFSIHGSGYFVKRYDTSHVLTKFFEDFPEDELLLFFEDPLEMERLKKKLGDITPNEQQTFFKTDTYTRLEISGGKKKVKIPFKSLINSEVLFDYSFVTRKQEDLFHPKELIVLEEDLGNFGRMTFPDDEFSLDKLNISVVFFQLTKEWLVSEIRYDDTIVSLAKSKTLNRSMKVRKMRF